MKGTIEHIVPCRVGSLRTRLPGGVVLRAANQNLDDCQWQSYLDSIAGRLDGSSEPARLTCAPAGAMQASNRRQAALSESQRGCCLMNGNSSKLPTTPPLPLRGTSPRGGSEKSAPERGAAAAAAEGCGRHPRFNEIPGEYVTAPLASPGGKLDFLAIGTSEPIAKKD